jgi:hypothetical protein
MPIISANLSGLGLKACQLPRTPFLDSFRVADKPLGTMWHSRTPFLDRVVDLLRPRGCG